MSNSHQRQQLLKKIERVGESDFEEIALEVFYYQRKFNSLFQSYLAYLRVPARVDRVTNIAFFPIQFFKSQLIQTGTWVPETVFQSSGTTGVVTSRHGIKSLDWYNALSFRCFQHFYHHPSYYCWLALLPNYLERSGSSLVHMVQSFIHVSAYPESGFFLYDHIALKERLQDLDDRKIPTILLGVSYALLDFAERFPMELPHATIMETGGMKGRHREIIRSELHGLLTKAFHVDQIHAEYGMTELLSQAYSMGRGIFRPSPTLSVLIRDITDPLEVIQNQRVGAINLIDLGNIDTISFIATDDLGRAHPDGSFEVLGRLDNSDLRGCNLLAVN